MDDIIFAFCLCFSSFLLTYTFCASSNNSSVDLFFQFSSFCNLEQQPEGLRFEGGGGGGVESWRAGLGPALEPELEEEQAKGGGGKGGE
jgi:hypothetical protein